jgi:hypothetical protein
MLALMADDLEPDDLDRRIERARKRMDTARSDLMGGIREALERKRSPTRIGRYAHWSPEYIKKIRDREADNVADDS